MGLRKFAKNTAGYACLGLAYQSGKRAIKSDSMIGSSFYSAAAGFFGQTAYKYLKDNPEYNVALDGLEKKLLELKAKKEDSNET